MHTPNNGLTPPSPGHRWLSAAGILLLTAAAVPPASIASPIQDRVDSARLRDLAEEQLRIQRAIDRLESTMESLARRLESEGRSQAVELLRAGLAKLRARDDVKGTGTIEERMRQIEEALKRGESMRALEEQNRLVKELEELLAILLDRKSLEKLEDQLEFTKKAIEDIQSLRQEERRLLQETERAKDASKSKDEADVSRKLDSLLERQRNLDARMRTEERDSGTAEMERRLRDLEELIRAQRAVIQSLARRGSELDPSAVKAGELADAGDEAMRNLEERDRARAAARTARNLVSSAKALAETPQGGESAERDFRDGMEDLASQARAEADQLRAQAQGAPADSPLAKSEAELAKLLDELAKQLAATGDAKGADARKKAMAAAAAAAEALERTANTAGVKAEKSVDSLAAKAAEAMQLEPDAESPARASLDAAAENAKAAVEARERSDEGSVPRFVQAARDLARAAARAAKSAGKPEALARRERELADEAERLARALRAASQTADSKAAAESLTGAKAALDDAASALDRQDREERARAARAEANPARSADPKAAGEGAPETPAGAESSAPAPFPEEARARASEGLRMLEAARDAAARDAKARAESRGPRRDALVQEQEGLAREASELARDIAGRQETGGLTPEQSRSAGESVREASEQMQQSARSAGSNQSRESSKARQEAERNLEEAKEALRRNRATSEETRKLAKDLAQRQEEIRKRILELAQRLKERPNVPRPRSLDDAVQSARRAEEALDEGDLDTAEVQEEKTEKFLDTASEEIEKEQRRFLRLKQEELLFRVGEELAAMEKEHDQVRRETGEIDSMRRSGDLPRAERVRVLRLSRSERALAERAATIAEALEKEETRVFADSMRACEEDLTRVGELMGEDPYRTDSFVRVIQDDVAKRVSRLKDALRNEAKRRRDNPQERNDQNQGNGGQGKPPLVPGIAELKMLKLLEDDLAERTLRLLEMAKHSEGFDSLLRSELNRLASRHSRLTELFVGFKTQLDLEGEDSEAGGGGAPAPKDGKK